jgi:hypothetical protein
LDQVSDAHDLETFAKYLLHLDWDTTMNEEYYFLMVNDTWNIVPHLKGRKLVKCKWVYGTKYSLDGSIEIHKARLVSKGFSHVEGIDYNESSTPVAKMNSIRLVLSFVPHINGRSIRWMLYPPSCMGFARIFYTEQSLGYV